MSDSPINGIVLRQATAHDAAALAQTIAVAFEQYRGKLKPESGAFRESAAAIAAELSKGSGAIIAERGGRVLGCVMTRVMDRDLYFGRLGVVPAARGTGLAKLLVAAVEAHARARGLAGVRLGVRVVLTDNQKLFQSLGYREISREAHEGFAYPTSINMRKALD